jgi:hypothetical protein
MLAMFGGLDGPFGVHVVGQGNVNDVELWVVQERLVITIMLGNSKAFRERFSVVFATACNGSDLCRRAALEGCCKLSGDVGCAENANLKWFYFHGAAFLFRPGFRAVMRISFSMASVQNPPGVTITLIRWQ